MSSQWVVPADLARLVEVRRTKRGMSLRRQEETASYSMVVSLGLVAGLLEARTDPTLFRVLPVMVLRNEGQFNWDDVRSRARRAKLKAELGMVLDLTDAVSGHASLCEQTHGLADRRRRVPRYLPEPTSEFERRLADKRTPTVARRWGFRMNMSEVSVRDFVRKHVA